MALLLRSLHRLSQVSSRLSSSLSSYVDRTHTCGELRSEHVGQRVTLQGWIKYNRFGRFLVLRDAYGITQVLVDDEGTERKLKHVSLESVLRIEGEVLARPEKDENPKMATGKVEVRVIEAEVVNAAVDLPFRSTEEASTLKYRYLSLRSEELQRNLRMRSELALGMREFLSRRGFVDVETPTLFRRTPGGAREFVVPTRTHPGKFYSLVQSPQQFKQLLMVSGVDKYYQIARCYRDEGGRPDRQPEFTQVDIELSFVDRSGIKALVEDLLVHSWPKHLPPIKTPFKTITHSEAMERYGSDKPDLRFSNEIVDLTGSVEKNRPDFLNSMWGETSRVKALNFSPSDGKTVTSKSFKELEASIRDYVKDNHPNEKVIATHFTTDKDGNIKSSFLKKFSSEIQAEIRDQLGCNPGDVGIIVFASEDTATEILGRARTELGEICFEFEKERFEFLWVEEFPLFEEDEENPGTLTSSHHPFTRPREQDVHLLDSNPSQVFGEHYDLVLNGQEVAGGSIRIHEPELQRKILADILKQDVSELEHLLDALSYGCPPHGGIAFGFDRLVAILAGAKNIREVIAFPKSSVGRDPMSDSPAEISEEEKKRYHIKTVDPIHD